VDFDAFLADCRAQWREFDDDAALARAPHPRDRHGYREQARAAQPRGGAPGAREVYVEIGCWQGLSLAGAVAGHAAAISSLTVPGGPWRQIVARSP
jgi:hypothetical protein